MKHNILSGLINQLWQSVVVTKYPDNQYVQGDLYIHTRPNISILVPKTAITSKDKNTLNDMIKFCIPVLLNYFAQHNLTNCVVAVPFELLPEQWVLVTLYVTKNKPKELSIQIYDPACVMDIQEVLDLGQNFTQFKIHCGHHVAVTPDLSDSGILVLFLLSQIMRAGRCGIPQEHMYRETMMRYIAEHLRRLIPTHATSITRVNMPITRAELLTLDALIAYRQFMPKDQFEEFVRLATAFYKANGIDDHDLKEGDPLYKAGTNMKRWFREPQPNLVLHNELYASLLKTDRDGDLVWVNSSDFDARQRLVDIFREWSRQRTPTQIEQRILPRPEPLRLSLHDQLEQKEVSSGGYSFKGTVLRTAISFKFVRGTEELLFPQNIANESLRGKTRSWFNGDFTEDDNNRARGKEINVIPDFPLHTRFEGIYKAGKPFTGTITCIVGEAIDELQNGSYMVYEGRIENGSPNGQGKLKIVQNTAVKEFITGMFDDSCLPEDYEEQLVRQGLSEMTPTDFAVHYYINSANLNMHAASHVGYTLSESRRNAQQKMYLEDNSIDISADSLRPAYAAARRAPLGDEGWAIGAPARPSSTETVGSDLRL